LAGNGSKMSNKSRQVRAQQIQRIKELLDQWVSDEAIMQQLNIPSRTLYRYKSSIYKQDTKLLAKTRTNELAHRILQVKKSLEYCISVNKDICENSKDDKARIEASALIVKAQMGLLNLINSGPHNEQVRIIHREVTDNTETEQ
jgi:hypothetical protein